MVNKPMFETVDDQHIIQRPHFIMKDKCCICDCVYVVATLDRELPGPDFKSACELGTSLGKYGVCAEALAYIQLVRQARPEWYRGSARSGPR